jgi:branched-chain amino acid transport system substrate-binding protein
MVDRKRFSLALASGLVSLTGRASAQGNAPYKIGVTFPLTGPLAASGLQFAPATEIAAAHINQRGGINGRSVQILLEDTLGSPQGGVAAMRKLVQVDGAAAIVSIYTNVVTAQIPLAEQLKVALMAPIQAPDLMSKSAYTFAHAETLTESARQYREYWRRSRVKRLFAFVPNNAIGPYYGGAAKASAAAINAEYAETAFTYGAGDYRGLVARVKEFNPDTIYLASQGGVDDTLVIKQLRETGVTAPINLAGNFFDDPTWRAAIGTYIEGLVMVGLTYDPITSKQFASDYRIRTGNLPPSLMGTVYDIVMMIAAAIKTGGYSGEGIAKQLAGLTGVPSVYGGTITMQPDHYSPPTNRLFQVRSGKLIALKA